MTPQTKTAIYLWIRRVLIIAILAVGLAYGGSYVWHNWPASKPAAANDTPPKTTTPTPPTLPAAEPTPNPEVVEARKQAAEATATAAKALAAIEEMKKERAAAQIAPPPAPPVQPEMAPRPSVPQQSSGPVRMVRSDGTIVWDVAPVNAPSGAAKFTPTGQITWSHVPLATHMDEVAPGKWELKPHLLTELMGKISVAVQPLRARNAPRQEIIQAQIAAAKRAFAEMNPPAPDVVIGWKETSGQQVASQPPRPRR